jgi:hypothetical protein
MTFADKVYAMPDDMTDAEVDQQITRADRFIADLRDLIADAIANPVTALDQHGQCLRRIAATLDAVPYVTFANLSNLDAAWRSRFGGMTLLSVIEVHLMAAGGGPTLDYPDATAFLATFQPMIEIARKRMLQ